MRIALLWGKNHAKTPGKYQGNTPQNKSNLIYEEEIMLSLPGNSLEIQKEKN